VIIATVVIICCMRKRKNNLREMERRVQMNTSDTSRSAKDTKDQEIELEEK
jgi:hypothetical protein